MNRESIATELLEAADHRSLLEPFSRRYPDFNIAVAYEVSAEILGRRRARGETPIGRKIGFTNRLIWDEYGVSSPMWAPVYDSTVVFLESPSVRLDISHLLQPRIEPEIILHFREAPNAAANEDDLLSTIDWIAHGFEIVQTHFPDWKFALPDTIADFGLHGALLVGPRQLVKPSGQLVRQLRAFTIALARDGSVAEHGAAANVLDGPLAAALFMLRVLAGQPQFEPVRAGEIVTTGTLTRALPIRAGERWTTSLVGIDLPGLIVQFD